MKKFFYIISLVVFSLFLATYSEAQTVYVTKEGKKYHKKNCTLAKEGKKGIDIQKAEQQGFQPCHVCKPNNRKSEATEPKK